MSQPNSVTRNTLIETIFELNRQGVLAYKASEKERKSYLSKNPTHTVLLTCMDGRAKHLLQTCGIPVGVGDIIQTAGVKFSVSSPYFASLLQEAALYAASKSRTPVFIVASHFSGNYPHHGCRAFENNREDARNFILRLASDIAWVFRKFMTPVIVLPVEFNTDDDSLIFLGKTHRVNTADFLEDKNILSVLEQAYPEIINTRAFPFISDLALCNIEHVKKVRAMQREECECHHGEFALAIGRGFGTWLNPHRNRAIILFGEGLQLQKNICTAGTILLENMKKNPQMQKHGALVISSAAYSQDWKSDFAMSRVEGYSELVRNTLSSFLPELHYEILEGIVDMRTWEFIERERWNELK